MSGFCARLSAERIGDRFVLRHVGRDGFVSGGGFFLELVGRGLKRSGDIHQASESREGEYDYRPRELVSRILAAVDDKDDDDQADYRERNIEPDRGRAEQDEGDYESDNLKDCEEGGDDKSACEALQIFAAVFLFHRCLLGEKVIR